MRKTSFILLFSVCLFLCGCATVYNPATERKELIFITTPTEVSIGKAMSANVANQFKLSKDPEQIGRVTSIGGKLANVSDRKDLKYIFSVVEEKELNAFTTPGGYVYVNSGLIEKTTDDELACVIGHEIGHVAAKHVAKKLQAQLGYDILMNIALQKSGISELRSAASLGFDLVLRGYSREDELLADRLGSKYAYKAGYDPYAMISFLKKIADSGEGDLGFIFLRSHPYTSQRIKMLEKQIPEMINKADKKNTAKIASVGANAADDGTSEKRPLKVMCPVCRKIFPGETLYCPYDGTKLE